MTIKKNIKICKIKNSIIEAKPGKDSKEVDNATGKD